MAIKKKNKTQGDGNTAAQGEGAAKPKFYKRKWFWAIIAVVLVIGIFGNSNSNDEQNAETEAPVESVEQDSQEEPAVEEKNTTVDIDFEKLNSDLHEDLQIGDGAPDYYFVRDYYVGLRDDGTSISLTAVVDDSTSPEAALDFADTLVRRTNLIAHMQDESIEISGADTYGGLYDRYDALVGVARMSDQSNMKAWLVNDAILSSDGPKLNLQNE